jgi:hypothetical protein
MAFNEHELETVEITYYPINLPDISSIIKTWKQIKIIDELSNKILIEGTRAVVDLLLEQLNCYVQCIPCGKDYYKVKFIYDPIIKAEQLETNLSTQLNLIWNMIIGSNYTIIPINEDNSISKILRARAILSKTKTVISALYDISEEDLNNFLST